MTLPELAKQTKSHRKARPSLYEWDSVPLPLLYASCKDKHTCDYYRLLKKQMHHHISVSSVNTLNHRWFPCLCE